MTVTLDQIMAELEANGSAQHRKVYTRHGYPENTFGVSFNVLRILAKRCGTDPGLARALWQTGNGDACILATMVADPQTMTSKEFDSWIAGVSWYVLGDTFATLAGRSPLARQKCDEWRTSSSDYVGQVGWNLVGILARDDKTLDRSWLEGRIAEIEASIHKANNRTKHAMNMALCAIGGYRQDLTQAALAAAKRIGKVVVDHGETGCKTPSAGPYIERMVARSAGKAGMTGKVASPGSRGQRVIRLAASDGRKAGVSSRVDSRAGGKSGVVVRLTSAESGRNGETSLRKQGGKKITTTRRT